MLDVVVCVHNLACEKQHSGVVKAGGLAHMHHAVEKDELKLGAEEIDHVEEPWVTCIAHTESVNI